MQPTTHMQKLTKHKNPINNWNASVGEHQQGLFRKRAFAFANVIAGSVACCSTKIECMHLPDNSSVCSKRSQQFNITHVHKDDKGQMTDDKFLFSCQHQTEQMKHASLCQDMMANLDNSDWWFWLKVKWNSSSLTGNAKTLAKDNCCLCLKWWQ